MTELDHGSNVRGLTTTAVYDSASQEFIINTPTDTATKWWIGNTACTCNFIYIMNDWLVHGKHVTVFADLIIGDKSYGIHAFIVPIRGDNMQPLPGM